MDFDSDDSDQLPVTQKPSNLLRKHSKLAPPKHDSDSSDSDEVDGPITAKNIEALSRAMDERATEEAALDAEELRAADAGKEASELDIGEDEDDDVESFHLPTFEEREEEKNSGGPDVVVIQRRMRVCARRLGNFKKYAGRGWCVSHFSND